jgi:hypothetical protein
VRQLPETQAQSLLPAHWSWLCTCEQSVVHLPLDHWQPACVAHSLLFADEKVQRVLHVSRTEFQSHSSASALQLPSVMRFSQSVTHWPVAVLTSQPVSFLHCVRSLLNCASQPSSHAPVAAFLRHSVVASQTSVVRPVHLGEQSLAVASQAQMAEVAEQSVELRPVHLVWHLPSAQPHAAAAEHTSESETVEHLGLHAAVLVAHWHLVSPLHSVRVWYASAHFCVHELPVTAHCDCVMQSAVVRDSHDLTHVPSSEAHMHWLSSLQSSDVL